MLSLRVDLSNLIFLFPKGDGLHIETCAGEGGRFFLPHRPILPVLQRYVHERFSTVHLEMYSKPSFFVDIILGSFFLFFRGKIHAPISREAATQVKTLQKKPREGYYSVDYIRAPGII